MFSRTLVVALPMLLASVVVRAAPATKPVVVDPEIRTWYMQLSDRDPEVRERARINLMGIPRSKLVDLEKIVAENRPVQASQLTVLQDIVTHVFIAGEPYKSAPSWGGFLGMRWDPAEPDFWSDPPGIIVRERLPGFCAYRMLREGDVIVGIEEMPGVTFANRNDFTAAVQRVQPGETITFLVLRGGSVQKVPLTLNARPAAAVANQPQDLMIEFENERRAKAEQYWTRTFAPLLESDQVTSSR